MKRTQMKSIAFESALLLHLAARKLRELYEELPDGETAGIAAACAKIEMAKDSLVARFGLNRKHVEGRR